MNKKSTVAFLGLGVMGGPMAGHLAKAGYRVLVFNRSQAKADRWRADHSDQAVAVMESPAAAARQADLVIACVGNDDDLREVTIGAQGAFSTMRQGCVFMDHTTASVQLARVLGETAKRQGLAFLDAPVSGGQAGAEQGRLTVMVGGPKEAFEQAQPVALAYARAFTHVGAQGAGQLAKMVNQICVAGVLQGLAEGLRFGMRAGLDMPLVLDVLRQGAAQSWQMDHRGSTMVRDEFDFGFAVDLMRKDLGLCLDEAARIGAELPGTAMIDQFYAELQQMDGHRWDTSSLIKRLA